MLNVELGNILANRTALSVSKILSYIHNKLEKTGKRSTVYQGKKLILGICVECLCLREMKDEKTVAFTRYHTLLFNTYRSTYTDEIQR